MSSTGFPVAVAILIVYFKRRHASKNHDSKDPDAEKALKEDTSSTSSFEAGNIHAEKHIQSSRLMR